MRYTVGLIESIRRLFPFIKSKCRSGLVWKNTYSISIVCPFPSGSFHWLIFNRGSPHLKMQLDVENAHICIIFNGVRYFSRLKLIDLHLRSFHNQSGWCENWIMTENGRVPQMMQVHKMEM